MRSSGDSAFVKRSFRYRNCDCVIREIVNRRGERGKRKK